MTIPATALHARPPLKLNVHIGIPTYAGNGGTAAVHPDVAKWYTETVLKMKSDPRIGEITAEWFSDTPVTLVRNRFVLNAQKSGAHLLLCCDSDQGCMRHVGEPWYKPFWDVAFDEVYNHYQAGPLVIGAPYCGPPPHENVYVFQFESNMSRVGDDESVVRLEQYTRSQASRMTGVTEVAALPTGMILFDMRIFDIYKPSHLSKRQVLEKVREGTMSLTEAELALMEGWFHYEWNDGFAAEKASTEDVSSTRDLAMACAVQLGYNPLRCAWDSWIGHHKPWNCGKPAFYDVENVSACFKSVVERGMVAEDRIVDFQSDALIRFQTPTLVGGNGNGKRH